MKKGQEISPTHDRPLLVGLLVDVSGSMTSSIQNRSGGSLNRLESFERSLGEVAEKARDMGAKGEKGLIKVFAYGFGFGNLISNFLGAGSEPKVQDILLLPGETEAAIDLDHLAENWDRYRQHVRGQATRMFGDTPMRQGFEEAIDRFTRERKRRAYSDVSVLFVLSDGEPTDVDDPSEIVKLAKELRNQNVEVISCYVTDADITEPRHLYGEPQSSWPNDAKLMFDVASELPRPSPFEAYMTERRWNVEEHGRLFTQINQSEILSEFLSVITSPLESSVVAKNEAPLASAPVQAKPPSLNEGVSVPEAAPSPSSIESPRGTAGQAPLDENRLYILIANWTFVTAILIGVIGVVLILAGGSEGETSFTLFGQSFKSVNVGIGAIFIAVVMVVLNVRRLFKSVDRKRQ